METLIKHMIVIEVLLGLILVNFVAFSIAYLLYDIPARFRQLHRIEEIEVETRRPRGKSR